MNYVIHLDFESFLAQAATIAIGDAPIYVQDYAATTIAHGIPHTLASSIVVTYADVGGTVHAARLLVETATLLVADQRAVHAALRRRTALARLLVQDALAAHVCAGVQDGLLLVPGLREDLNHFETDHDLWRWEEAQDPLRRRLVAQRDGAEAER